MKDDEIKEIKAETIDELYNGLTIKERNAFKELYFGVETQDAILRSIKERLKGYINPPLTIEGTVRDRNSALGTFGNITSKHLAPFIDKKVEITVREIKEFTTPYKNRKKG